MSRIDLAYTLHQNGDLAAAEVLYRAMIRERDDAASAATNLFILLREGRRWPELARLYHEVEDVVRADPVWASRFYRELLIHGEYEAGWQWYEARRYDRRRPLSPPPLSIPEWRGEPVGSLLVWREQGLGDEIQFARYVSLLARRGVRVTLLCHPNLARLFRNLPAEVAPLRGSVQLRGPFDAWTFLASLPLRLGGPFDVPPPLEVSAAPRGGAGGVGVMTHGAPGHPNDANRSLSQEAAARLLASPGAISLRPEDTGAQDLQDTAEIIAGLDCVVTVDTSVAHLAGSLGKPTFVMLPAVRQDWRWMLGRRDSPWYPSVRLVRQAAPGDWNGVIDRVLPEIAEMR